MGRTPPLLDIRVKCGGFRMVEEATQPAEELRVRKLSLSEPAKVFVVLGRVLTEESQVLGETAGPWKVVHVKEGVRRSHSLIILQSGPHHHRQNLHQQLFHNSDQDTQSVTRYFSACQNFSEI